MNQRKIKILGIAPYQNLKKTMDHLASAYENLELTTYVGNLEAGVEIARQHGDEGFDMIISRGGTAELLKTVSNLPIVEIPLSVYDILRAIRLIGSSVEKYAIVGFSSITTIAHLLCDLLNYPIEIITIHHESDVPSALNALKQKGYRFILCDMITDTIARQSGMTPILITSGVESIETALKQATQLDSSLSALTRECTLLEEALKRQSADTIILHDDGSVFFSTYYAENISIIMDYLKELIKKPQSQTTTKAFHLIDHTLYALSMTYFHDEAESYYLFCIEPNPVPANSSKYGLHFSSYEDMVSMYSNSFYSLTSSAVAIGKQIEQFNQSMVPVMILGERGSGKNQVAAKIYIESERKNNPYITIDCQLINDKMWDFITKHYNSPFCGKDNTIFISNIQALSSTRQQQLLSLIIDTNAHKRNRLLLSCSQTLEDDSIDPSRNFIDYLPCVTIYLPPFRELTEDMTTCMNLYLNTLNIELSKQVIGFEPDALSFLRNYSWPDNFMQLKRVLTELVLLTDSPYISSKTVEKVLKKETQQYVPCASSIFDYNRPLDDMIHEIVKVVVSQCDGNQTQAAKRLAIGRTTLWRYLNSKN